MENDKKKSIKMIKEIPLESKHIRWNVEISKDNFHMDIPLARYYFAIVDKRDAYRKEISDKIITKMTKTGSSVIQIESPFEIQVKKGEYGLLFVTYDALVKPEILNLENLNIPIRRDYELKGKKVLDIEDYLTRIYE